MSDLVINKLEKLINKTPTGDLRNELTEINILIQSKELQKSKKVKIELGLGGIMFIILLIYWLLGVQ